MIEPKEDLKKKNQGVWRWLFLDGAYGDQLFSISSQTDDEKRPLNCSTWALGYVQGKDSWQCELLSTDLGY